MDYKNMLCKMEEVFINLGFETVIINNVRCLKYKECYCKVTFIKEWSAFVVESADNIKDAENGVFEDSDVYDITEHITENKLLDNLRDNLVRYYLN